MSNQESQNPLPSVPAAIANGLEAIKSYGNSDAELYVKADDGFFEETFMTSSIVTADENTRFIKKIEAMIRGSFEYTRYIGYLRNDLKMDRCSFFSGLDFSDGELTLEMHHCPLNLYDIVEVVINHRLARNQPVTSMTVAEEVLYAHLQNKVGLIPVSKTAHKLIHSNTLKVHPAMVHGNWMDFLRDYPDGVTEMLMDKLLAFVNISELTVAEAATKIDGRDIQPLLRGDSVVPDLLELRVLLSHGGGR